VLLNRSQKKSLAAGLCLGLVSVFGAGRALAQGAPAAARPAGAPAGPMKIAVINTEQILLDSQTGKKALADLKKVQDQKEAELNAKQEEIKVLQAKIDSGRLSLAQDKLADLEKQLEDKVIAGRRLQDDANRDLNKKKDDVLGSVDQRVMPVITQLGKEMGFTLIFRKFESGLIYADDAIDITPLVIQRLDAANAGK
jgi:Skp family chaperone for outer membrane proteins